MGYFMVALILCTSKSVRKHLVFAGIHVRIENYRDPVRSDQVSSKHLGNCIGIVFRVLVTSRVYSLHEEWLFMMICGSLMCASSMCV